MRHFDVQLMGGIVLHQGRITEMKTGEGKTLVATLPVYLNALSGNGVHVVTVNDYLARRDSEWMGTIYKFLGLEVGVIQHDLSPRASARSRTAAMLPTAQTTSSGSTTSGTTWSSTRASGCSATLNFAIVDEVDSILIDEARTPLIISGSTEESTKKYYLINKIILNLKDKADYEVNEKDRHVTLTEDGVRHVERLLKIDNLYDNRHIDTVHHVNQALKAHTLFNIDEDYIVKDGQVIIVDEFTGRLMPGRRYSDGLHQALEAKENVTIARESQTLATDHLPELFQDVQQARRHDRNRGHRGGRVPEDIQARRRGHTHQHADGAPGLSRQGVPHRKGEIRRDSKRDTRAEREEPADPRGHHLDRKVGKAVAPAPRERDHA